MIRTSLVLLFSVSAAPALAQDKAAAKPAAATPPPAAPAAAPPAAAPAPPAPPKPGPEMKALEYMAGNWRCEGKQFAGPMGPEHTFKATAKLTIEPPGFWHSFVYQEKKSKEHPMAGKVMGAWGWDAGRKKYVRADRDSWGGWFAPTGTLEGDKLIWTGEISNPLMPSAPARHTFTKKSDKEFSHAFEVTMNGKPTPMFDVTCKK